MQFSIILSIFLFISSIALALISLYYKSHKSDNEEQRSKNQKKFGIFISVSVILLILSIVVYKLFGVTKLQLAKEILSEQDSKLLDNKCLKLFSSDAGLKKQYLDFRGTGELSYETANLCRKYAQTIAGVKV